MNYYNQKYESYGEGWEEQRSGTDWGSLVWVFLFIGVFSIAGVFLVFAFHDQDIDREEMLYSIYSNDSCDELLHALSFEDRKIMRDQVETKVLTNFITEKNC